MTDIIFFFGDAAISFTSIKLYVCGEIFSYFLQLSDRAYAFRAQCIGLFALFVVLPSHTLT